MRCCDCGEKIEVGDKVYAGIDSVWHTSCGEGAWAGGGCVAGSLYRLLRNQERYK